MNKNNSIENVELENLPNIGKEMKKQLNAIGINTPEDLVETGSREAWLRISERLIHRPVIIVFVD